jgi:nucleoside phosphorylase
MSITIQIRSHAQELDGNYVLLLTSNSVERDAVNGIMDSLRDADVGRATRGSRIGFLGRSVALHVTGESGVSKRLSIGRIAGGMLADPQFPRPSLVLLVGFCWGNPEKAAVGSVLVSSHIVSLNEVRETPNGREWVPHPYQSTLELTPEFIDAFGKALVPHEIFALSGPMGSEETLYRHTESRDLLIRRFPELFGGEMEAFALLPVDVPWLVVKSVSDLGDSGFDRDQQKDAARRAAKTVETLVTMLSDEGYLPERKSNASPSLLEDLIAGNALTVDVRDTSANELNDVLNNKIGRLLEDKLCRYVSQDEYDPEFPSLMCALLLEIMQNAINHGAANRATVTIQNENILIEDDGKAFDPGTLTGANGGARDWRAMRERYIDKGEVRFTAKQISKGKGNRYLFALLKASSVLRDTRQNCSMQIATHSIGVRHGRPPILTFNEDCRILYLNTGILRMTSRRIELANALRDVVAGGRKVYVGCPSERDEVFFKEELKDLLGENLVVFVDTAR